jgi:hypothetical protein
MLMFEFILKIINYLERYISWYGELLRNKNSNYNFWCSDTIRKIFPMIVFVVFFMLFSYAFVSIRAQQFLMV